ncbi:MAG: tandem-95 repeat protein, partial [Sphingobacteriales bacterium]
MHRNLLRLFLSLCLILTAFQADAQLPFSLCSPTGGARADLLAAKAAYRAGGSSTPVTFTIPVGTATVMVYTSSHDSRLTWGTASTLEQHTDEDYITINAILNLKTKQSSGFLNFAQYTQDAGTNLYGWRNVDLGTWARSQAINGHDISTPILNNVKFSVSGNTLTIAESNTDIYTSYYVEFVSADISSLNANGFDSRALLKNNTNLSIPIPANTNVIFVSGKGTNGTKAAGNTSEGGTEEGFSNMRFAIDVNNALIDGFVTVVNGNATTNGGRQRRSTYVINDQNALDNTNLLSTGNVTGDYTGKTTTAGGDVGLYNPKIYISGSNLIIERDAGYGADFDDVYTFEFYTRINQPTSAEFIDNETRFIAPTSDTPKSVKAKIPAGSRFIYFNQTGNAINSADKHNENSMAAYAVIDLQALTASGFYYQQVGVEGSTRRDDNFAFKGLPLNGVSSRSATYATGVFFNPSGNTARYDLSFELKADKSEITITNTMALVHDKYQVLMSLDFFGSRPDLAFNTSHISFSKGTNCKEVEAKVRISNPGSGESPGSIPVSFYDSDPTVNPNAKRLLTDVVTFNEAIPSLQEKDFVFKIDLSSYQNLNIPITMILNDDGSFAPTLNQAIGTPFALESLRNQSDKRIECDYNNNKFSATINVTNCPTVNLDPDNSSGASANNYLDYFLAGSTGTSIADNDMIIVDPENNNLQSATITLTNRPDGNASESLFVDGTLPAGLTASYNQTTGALTITGNASQADYITAIKMVKYKTTETTPITTDRIITTTLNDGVEVGPASTTTIKILTSPRINVTGNEITIADGVTTTNAPDGTNYGNVSGSTGVVNHTFVIQNVGTGTINLTAPGNKVVLSGHPGFSVTTQPSSIALSSSATSNFIVGFDTNAYPAKGTYNATISIVNDDPFADRKNYTFVVQININNVPTVQDFPKSGPEDTPIVFSAADFTSHFTDADSPGDNLTEIEIVDLPLNGTLKLGGVAILPGQKIPFAQLGNITFTPSANWNGNTSFNWKATDGLAYSVAPAKVNINITPVNDPPVVATVTKTGSKNVTVPFSDADFKNKFTDIDGDLLTKIKIETLPLVTEGTLKLNGVAINAGDEIDAADLHLITFVPATNWSGSTSFTWNGFDGTAYANSPAAVNITLTDQNSRPTVADISKSGPQNVTVPFTVANFTDKFFDIDGSLTKIKILSLPANGSLQLNGMPVTSGQEINTADLNKITFVPNTNWTGTTTFGWNGYDAEYDALTPALVNITITPNNPPIVNDISKTGTEDTPVNFSLIDFSSKFSDVDGNSLTRIHIISLPTNGQLFINGIAITTPTSIGPADAALLTFLPNPNWNGTTSFKWNGYDGTSLATSDATVNIEITAVNDDPVFSQPNYTDSTCEAVVKGGSITAATDAEGNTLSYALGTAPTKGTATINATTGAYNFTPTAGETGTDSFTIVASDGNGGTATATVSFTINARPVVAAIAGTGDVCVNGTRTLTNTTANGVWASASTNIATISTAGVVTGVASGTSIISYTVTDATTGCATTVNYTITVNAKPVVAAISGTGDVCVNGTRTLTNTTANGVWASASTNIATISTAGVVTGVASGTSIISYTVTDATTGCATTVNYTITVNARPVVAAIAGTGDVCVDGTRTLTNTTANGVWSSASTNIATISTTGVVTGIASGTSIISYTVTDATTGCATTVNYTITVNARPNTSTFVVTNGINSGTITVDIVNGVTGYSIDGTTFQTSNIFSNLAPGNYTITVKNASGCTSTGTATIKPAGTADSDITPINTGVTTKVTTNDGTSGTGADVTATNGTNGTTTVNADGSVKYTPNAGFVGTDTYTYTITKNGITSDPITVTITIYNATLSLTKKADNATLITKAGDIISYTIEVENTGTSTLTNIAVSDAGADAGSISPANISTLAAGSKATVTAKHTLLQSEVDAGSFSNQASGKGKDPLGNDVEDVKSDDPGTATPNDPTIVNITATPKITLVKTGTLSSDGNTISYSFLITNTGNVTLNNPILTDT